MVYSSPANLEATGGYSGGVAIVVPTHWMPGLLTSETVVPGYVLQITKQYQQQSQTWTVAYLRPGHTLEILRQWDQYWTRHPPRDRVYIGGDLNRIDTDYPQEWFQFLMKWKLADVTGNTRTFALKDGGLTSLDKWVIRDDTYSKGHLTVKVKAT